MARRKNELTPSQQDKAIFEGLRAEIKRFGGLYLSTLGNVSNTTIYSYARGIAVGKSTEREIKHCISKAKKLKKQADEDEILDSRALLNA